MFLLLTVLRLVLLPHSRTPTSASSYRQPLLDPHNSSQNAPPEALPNHQRWRWLDLALLPPTFLSALYSLHNLTPRSPPNHIPAPPRWPLGTSRCNTRRNPTRKQPALQCRQGLCIHARRKERARGFGYGLSGVPEEGGWRRYAN